MIETRQLSQLIGWDKNPRTLTKEAFERLKWQITHLNNGQPYKPLLINQDNIVLGGNMRIKAYKELGIDPVEVSVVQTNNESEMWEFALSDNDHVGTTDAEKIMAEAANLNIDWSQYAVDINPPKNLQELINSLTPAEEDEVPDVGEGEPESKLGEVYQLGKWIVCPKCGKRHNL